MKTVKKVKPEYVGEYMKLREGLVNEKGCRTCLRHVKEYDEYLDWNYICEMTQEPNPSRFGCRNYIPSGGDIHYLFEKYLPEAFYEEEVPRKAIDESTVIALIVGASLIAQVLFLIFR